ncbi:MAG: class I SAM-dependent methyltransferase [Alkalispirochaeta sp.]
MGLPSSMNPDLLCRLCGGFSRRWARSIHGVRYEWCPQCGAVQRSAAHLPSQEAEIARYREHNNQPDNQDYRDYLQRFIDSAIVPYTGVQHDSGYPLRDPPHILDFGSGPHPVLSDLLRDQGFSVSSYDPFFLPDNAVLEPAPPGGPRYDAIVLLEVIEHLHQPREELDRLLSLLRPGGKLILRTGLFDARDPAEDVAGTDERAGETANGAAAERFLAWWYRRDPTHVVFLTPRTLDWLQEHYEMRLIHRAKGEELVFARGE